MCNKFRLVEFGFWKFWKKGGQLLGHSPQDAPDSRIASVSFSLYNGRSYCGGKHIFKIEIGGPPTSAHRVKLRRRWILFGPRILLYTTIYGCMRTAFRLVGLRVERTGDAAPYFYLGRCGMCWRSTSLMRVCQPLPSRR